MELGNSIVKTPEAETENPIRIQSAKPATFTNGVLKRHAPLHLQRNRHRHHHPVVVTYKECLKNHAATMGSHAVDGCGEFMPSPNSNPAEPTTLKCAACGCHRNFHRREPDELPHLLALDYLPHHRHHPLPPPPRGHRDGSPGNSPSPPPISSSYAPHMLLALSHAPPPEASAAPSPASNAGGSRKRFRTKFTQNQKDKMLELAERVGWKMQKKDEDDINGICNEIGVEKGVFKVWMHNNKNIATKKDQFLPPPPADKNGINYVDNGHHHDASPSINGGPIPGTNGVSST